MAHKPPAYEPPRGSLHAAAARGDVEALGALLDGGADVNAVDADAASSLRRRLPTRLPGRRARATPPPRAC